MLNAFTVSYISAINALIFSFMMLSASAMLNVIMQNLKSEFRILSMFNVQSFFIINQNY